VIGSDAIGLGKTGDGAGDFEDAIVGSGAQTEFRHGHLEQFLGLFIQCAEFLEFLRSHVRVAADKWFTVEAGVLSLTCRHDTLTNLRGGFASAISCNLAKLDLRDLHMDVNAVEQGIADAR